MRSHYKIAGSIYALLMISIGSCKKFVQIPPPQSEIVTASVFNNDVSATAAMTVIYSQMFNDAIGYNMALYTGFSGDELTNYYSGNNQIYKNDLTASSPNPGNWRDIYLYIYEANALLEGVNASSSLSAATKKQLSGEAYFIRGFWYYYLVNQYGPIPVYLTTDYHLNQVAFRQSPDSVYGQIIADIAMAKSLLSTEYIDATNTGITTDRVRPNKAVADALLARVYLAKKDYSNAASEADLLINNAAVYSLEPDVNKVFLIDSKETIWSLLTITTDGTNTPEGAGFILAGLPGNGSPSAISDQLLNAFDPADLRRANWISSITVDGSPYYFPFKYKVKLSTDITERSAVLRLAEQYLIRAEAYAQQDKFNEAVDDINMIRNRAGLDPYVFTTKDELLKEILKQRQLELFAEWGFRWIDLKRMGAVDSVMTQVCPLKGNSWKSYQQLYPIPQTDINLNPHLTQNSGY